MKLLSAPELSLSHRRGQEQSLPSRGVKQFTPSHSWLETKHIQSALEERKSLVGAERIEKWSVRACAIWKPDKNVAEVTRKVGKCWHFMGIEKGGSILLQPEEALYMLETNLLELQYEEVAVSVQEAYALLLGPSCTLAEYRTYSKLQRLGFYLMRYREPSSQCGPSIAGIKRRHEAEKDSHKKRRVSNESPNKKLFDPKIELIDLEDDEPIVNDLKFVPNIINKESFTVIVAPDDLLPDNIKLHSAEYYINLRRLQEPGKGTRPATQPPTNWNQPFQGQPLYNNRPMPNIFQNMAQRFPMPFMQQNNMFMRMQQFSRPVFNFNCYMSYQFPFLPARLSQSFSAQMYARGLNPFTQMGRPMMAQNRPQMPQMATNSFLQRYRSPVIANPRQDGNDQQQRYLPSIMARNSREEAQQRNQETKSLTPPPNPSVPKLKAKSWAEVKAQLATTIVTITLDEEDQTTTFTDNKSFVQPEDCKSLDTILSKLQIFKKYKPKKEAEKTSLEIKFDAFQADPAFRKSEPSTPAYHVVVVSSPEALLDVSDISPDGVPLLYAIVQPDTINFFTLGDIEIPTIVS